MYITYILFVVGFIFLIKGADFLVDGASSIAKRLRVTDLVIGLTIVSFGTSAPELLVNIVSALRDSGDLAIGNVIGSNISNILLILGIAAAIFPLAIKKGTTWKAIPLSLLAIISVGVLANDGIINGEPTSLLTRGDGIIMLLFFIIFLYYAFGTSKVEETSALAPERIPKYTHLVSITMIIGGMIGLAIGGRWIVGGAILIATNFGISQAFIGLTIVAIGTSLPELATSVIAALKHKSDISVGNVVGSNIFNLWFVLGTTSIIRPIDFSPVLNNDIVILTLTTFLLFTFMFVGRRHTLERAKGVNFIILYVVYIVYLIARG